MKINKTAEVQQNQTLQTVGPTSTSKKFLGREFSPAAKIALGTAALGALALTSYAAYTHFSSINQDPNQDSSSQQSTRNPNSIFFAISEAIKNRIIGSTLDNVARNLGA